MHVYTDIYAHASMKKFKPVTLDDEGHISLELFGDLYFVGLLHYNCTYSFERDCVVTKFIDANSYRIR